MGSGCTSADETRTVPAVAAVASAETQPATQPTPAPQEGAAPAPTGADTPQGGQAFDGCAQENLQLTVRTRRSQVTACYQQALRNAPELAGRIAVRLSIDGSGALVGTGVTETDFSNELGACILKALRGLQFSGRFERPCTVVYPFVFSSGSRTGP